jgi:hypothetical protein
MSRSFLLALLAGVGLALLGLTPASAQCVGVGGVNNVPQTGLSCSQESATPTYSAASIGIVPTTAPTDIFCLTGSATRTLRVKQIRVSGTAGTAINITANLTKHTVANTGGTAASTAATGLPALTALDSAFPTTTATATGYTANPTIDSTAVVVSSQTMFLPVTSTAGGGTPATWDWSDTTAISPPVLRGVAQQLCINYNGVTTPSSGVVTVTMTYTETPQ